jgi:beta-galactosidase
MEQSIQYGAAYYPELWPESQIHDDIEKMKEAGITFARIGEFAWSVMEPSEGEISLDYFKTVCDTLHDSGISIVLCTPTATPPRWFSYGHPDDMVVNKDGVRMEHGARQHAC